MNEQCERPRDCRDDQQLGAAIDRTGRYVAGLRQELLPPTPAEEQRRIDEAFSQRLAQDASEPGRDYTE